MENNIVLDVVKIMRSADGAEAKSIKQVSEKLMPILEGKHPSWWEHRVKTYGDLGLREVKRFFGTIEEAYLKDGGNLSTFRSRKQRVYDYALSAKDPAAWALLLEARSKKGGTKARLSLEERVKKSIVPIVKAALEMEDISTDELALMVSFKRLITEVYGLDFDKA